eukprot:753656-Hanusia_phi.AAC.19
MEYFKIQHDAAIGDLQTAGCRDETEPLLTDFARDASKDPIGESMEADALTTSMKSLAAQLYDSYYMKMVQKQFRWTEPPPLYAKPTSYLVETEAFVCPCVSLHSRGY